MAVTENPYRSVAGENDDPFVDDEFSILRRKYLKDETSIKAIGYLYFLSGAGFLCAAGNLAYRICRRVLYVGVRILSPLNLNDFGWMAVALFICIFSIILGFAIRRLSPPTRYVTLFVAIALAIYAVLSRNSPLLVVPLFTVYLLFNRSGKMVFSPEYQQLMNRTKYVKYHMPVSAKVGGIFAFLISVAFISFLMLMRNYYTR